MVTEVTRRPRSAYRAHDRRSSPSAHSPEVRPEPPLWGGHAAEEVLPSLFKDRAFAEEFLDTFSCEIVVLDHLGRQIAANHPWRQRSNVASKGNGDSPVVSLDFLGADPRMLESLRSKLARILAGDLRETEIEVGLRSGGKAKRYHLHMAAVENRGERYAILVLDDVSETYALHRDKRLLTDQLMRSEERERGRIAREMHDSTVQDLVAIGLNLKRLRHLADDALAQEVLAEVRTILTRTQEDVRTLSYLLHPPLLEEGGLVLALASLIQGLSSRMHIYVEFDTDVSHARLPADIEMALYRVAQEALINVHKHAAATHAVVHLNAENDRLVLEVEDDGVGISAQHAYHIGTGVGIQGMRARLMQLGGALTLSTLKHGTRLKAVVPLRQSATS